MICKLGVTAQQPTGSTALTASGSTHRSALPSQSCRFSWRASRLPASCVVNVAFPIFWRQCAAMRNPSGLNNVSVCMVAAGLAGGLLLCQPVQAATWLPGTVLLDGGSGNAAIISQLKQLQQAKQKFGTQDPAGALAARFAGAQQQLQRIELLVKIQQYDNARMQLREGSFKSLRSDLRYESEFRGVQPEATRAIIDGVELLDRQLRNQEPNTVIAEGIQQLQQQLQQLVDQAQPPT